MTRIERNLQLPYPENCHLLADRILANRFPFLTARKSVQLGAMKGPRLRKSRKFNSYLRNTVRAIAFKCVNLKRDTR